MKAQDTRAPDDIASIDRAALLAAIDSGAAPAILDVRSRVEFSLGHVPGAIHRPFWLLSWRLRSIPARRDDPIVVYCGHGPRAWLVARLLRRRGFTRVRVLSGHFSGWRAARLAQER